MVCNDLNWMYVNPIPTIIIVALGMALGYFMANIRRWFP